MSQKTKETSLAELDPDQLTPADRLRNMAEQMRKDGLVNVYISDWTLTKHRTRTDKVHVEFVTPSHKRETVSMDWPDKPTEDNLFIRTCMRALDVGSPQEAALMADDLQDVEHFEFNVPADKDGGWSLRPDAPGAGSLRYHLSGLGVRKPKLDPHKGYPLDKIVVMTIIGPLTLILRSLAALDSKEPGKSMTEKGLRIMTIYGMVGTTLWLLLLYLA